MVVVHVYIKIKFRILVFGFDYI